MRGMNIKFKVGDLITTYHKGVWRIIKIERRFYKDERDIPSFYKNERKVGDEYSPIIHYERVCTFDGKETKGKGKCDAQYCEYVDKYIESEYERIELLLDIIEKDRK